MNWWMLGCGAAVIAEIFTLYCLGKEVSKRKDIEKTCAVYKLGVNIADPLLKCQNSMIDELIKKIPDKNEVEES